MRTSTLVIAIVGGVATAALLMSVASREVPDKIAPTAVQTQYVETCIRTFASCEGDFVYWGAEKRPRLVSNTAEHHLSNEMLRALRTHNNQHLLEKIVRVGDANYASVAAQYYGRNPVSK